MSKFNAAVNILAHEAMSAESAGRNDITLSILSVLAFLEAAGKVDREKAIDDLDDAISIIGHGALDSVMDLLAAIPGSDEKRVEDEAYLRNMDEPGPKEDET